MIDRILLLFFFLVIVVVVVHVVVVVKAEILLFLLLLLISESYIESLIEIGSETAEILLTLCLCGWVVVGSGWWVCRRKFFCYVRLSCGCVGVVTKIHFSKKRLRFTVLKR